MQVRWKSRSIENQFGNSYEKMLKIDWQRRLKSFKGEGIETDSLFESGTPFLQIITEARRLNSDLIIMATHGWGALKHLMLGSTAERLVREAPCPVLTVRHALSLNSFIHSRQHGAFDCTEGGMNNEQTKMDPSYCVNPAGCGWDFYRGRGDRRH
jgi:hypothetical protein